MAKVELIVTDDLLSRLEPILERAGASLEDVVQAVAEAMNTAEVMSKAGDILPDQRTRLAAAQVLLDIHQVALRTKASALRRLSGHGGIPIEQALAKSDEIPTPPPPASA